MAKLAKTLALPKEGEMVTMPNCDLTQKRCVPCEGGIPALTETEAKALMAKVPQWRLVGNQIEREIQFENFLQNMAFVNAVADIAEEEGHHPDILIHHYNQLKITLWTHAVKGLTENDFILAAKIDELR